MLRYQEGLYGFKKAQDKLKVVDKFYGSVSFPGLAEKRQFMAYEYSNPLVGEPEQ